MYHGTTHTTGDPPTSTQNKNIKGTDCISFFNWTHLQNGVIVLAKRTSIYTESNQDTVCQEDVQTSTKENQQYL